VTTLTPVEQARQAYEAAQGEVQRLSHEAHQLSRDYAAARAAGDTTTANALNAQISQSNVAYRLAGGGGGGHLAEAQGAVQREERAIRQARNRVADLTNAHNRLSKESVQAIEQAHLLTSGLQQVQQQLAEAHEKLAQLEPPEQPAAEVAPAPEPAPEVERDPSWPQPSRVVHDYPIRYYTRDESGAEIACDANGRPLDLPEVPEP
jgi:hypothetical protein